MKKYNLSLIFVLMSASLLAQNIITVSPVPLEGDYTNLQTAINAASTGDTIYCYPASYGANSIDKKLVLIASGYRITENPTLNISTLTNSTAISTLNLNAGSDHVVVKGFSIGHLNILSSNSITLQGCHFGANITVDNSTNTFFSRCFFTNNDKQCRIENQSTAVIANCIFTRQGNYTAINVTSTSSAEIYNCIFDYLVSANNSTIKNCVFLRNNTSVIQGSNNTIEYNIFVTSTNYGPTNLNNVASSSIFEGYPTQGSYSFDSRFELKAGSPALGFGEGGVDCGAFDGDLPYKLSGIPDIPLVYEFNVPRTTTGGSIDVNIKVRAEN